MSRAASRRGVRLPGGETTAKTVVGLRRSSDRLKLGSPFVIPIPTADPHSYSSRVWCRGWIRCLPWLSRAVLVGVLAVAAVVGAPWAGPASAVGSSAAQHTVSPRLLTSDPGDPDSDGDTDTGSIDPGTESSDDPTATIPPPTDASDGETDGTDGGTDDPTDGPTDGTDDGTGSDGGSDEQAALSIEATASPQVVEQGDTLTLTIVVANAGPGSDPGVTVNAQLPDGFVLQGSVGGYNATTGVWDVGAMLAGDTATLTLVVAVRSEPAEVVTSPTVSGESTDSLPLDDEAWTLVDVRPATPAAGGSDGGSDGSTGEAPVGEPTQSGSDLTHAGDAGTTGDDSIGDGDTAQPPGTAGESAAPPFSQDGTDDGDDTAEDPSASSVVTSTQAEARSDVGFDPTGSDAALLMLGWMLLAAGFALLLMGRLRRKKLMGWSTGR